MKIAVIGSGIVGQASGKGFVEKGHNVVFFDINPVTIDSLREGGYEAWSMDMLNVQDAEIFFLSVSTPTVDGKIQLSFLQSAVAALGEKLKEREEYFVVVVRSTVPPGTTEKMVTPLLEKYSGKKVGKDFGVGMNPEFLREETAEEDFSKPWIIISGAVDERSFEVIKKAYKPFGQEVHKLSIKEAEMLKYVHNLFNACKISYFNEMRLVSQEIGIDPDRIFQLVSQSAEASWNAKYGIKDLGPFGGSCLPKDTVAFLHWTGKEVGMKLPLLKSVIIVNECVKKRGK